MKYTVNDGFPYYIEVAGDKDYNQLFSAREGLLLFKSLTEEGASYRYAPGKWSIKQLIGHLTDHERIMVYRILRFSKQDKTILPGYDENFFVDNSRFDELTLGQLVTDFENVRNASISFIQTLSKAQLAMTGKAWKYEMTIEEYLKSIVGHELHHLGIIKERYLN